MFFSILDGQMLMWLHVRWNFDNVFAFGASRFISCESTSFILDFVMSVTIQGFPVQTVLPGLLKGADTLGRHSSIIHIASGKFFVYQWKHPTLAPNGHQLPLQCSDCGRIRSFRLPRGDPAVCVVRCTGVNQRVVCSGVLEFREMPGFSEVKMNDAPAHWMFSEMDKDFLHAAIL
jgi:hypothetical protein